MTVSEPQVLLTGLAFRESPYSLVHVENMRRVTLAGAIVAPPTPAFYVREPSMDRFLDAWCARAAGLLGIPLSDEAFRWAGTGKERARKRRRLSHEKQRRFSQSTTLPRRIQCPIPRTAPR